MECYPASLSEVGFYFVYLREPSLVPLWLATSLLTKIGSFFIWLVHVVIQFFIH